MGYFEAVVLGIVQGATEFLPVSSSAHLILARLFLGWDADQLGMAFDVACHVGTLLAVVAFFRRDFVAMALAVPDALRPDARGPARLLQLVAVGTIPVVIVGVLAAGRIEEMLRTPWVTVVTLTIVAVLFLVVERIGNPSRDVASASLAHALAIGTAQAAALVPGVSRSGATITAGMFTGLRRDAAARFSFVLGVPAILAAALHEGWHLWRVGVTAGQGGFFVIGMTASAVVGYVAIAFCLKYLASHTLAVFAWYRIALAAVTAFWLVSGRG
ncbi:MAG: undecaprenyl-diphosphatase UppP [Acidobacteria bacterium]|nr:undecaprenyl-diphosphatase UppP [Acidobacteriota bacterium]